MKREKLSPEIIDKIKNGAPGLSHGALAAELQVSEAVVRKYRKAGRIERQEVAKEILTRRLQDELPSALDDLALQRKYAREDYESARGEGKATPELRAWHEVTVNTLKYVGLTPEKDPLEDEPDETLLAELAGRLGMVRK